MTKKVTSILALLMTLILMGSCETIYTFAQEYEVEEDSAIDDIEDNLPEEFVFEEDFVTDDIEVCFTDNNSTKVNKNITDEELNVEINGSEIPLYVADEIEAIDAGDETEQDSIIHCGSVSGYLSETGDYILYPANLSAGDYLQARLSVPSNAEINYALVLYDSSLNVIKLCDYITYLNGTKSLEESIGYLSTSDERIYIGVFACYGGSETEAYTLDFTITTNFLNISDGNEPNENAQEASVLNLGQSGASVSGMLISAIDNEWYTFSVLDKPEYNKIRLQVSSTSNVNGCKMEIYRNLIEDDYAMQLVASGTEGEISLPAGTYFLRVVSTNTFSDFNSGDIPTYNLSVVPVSRVDAIDISSYSGTRGVADVAYPEGLSYCLFDAESNFINIRGFVYYKDSMGNKHSAANVKLIGKVVNTSWESRNRPDISTTYGTTITRANGYFTMRVNLNRSLGLRTYHGDYYDYMTVEIYPQNDSQKCETGYFYLLDTYVSN